MHGLAVVPGSAIIIIPHFFNKRIRVIKTSVRAWVRSFPNPQREQCHAECNEQTPPPGTSARAPQDSASMPACTVACQSLMQMPIQCSS
eukprot:305962-Karenia_brevis.AAC.1